MIAHELQHFEEHSFSEASPKEKVFYLFMTDGDASSIKLGNSDLEHLVIDAFILRTEESSVLKNLQRSKPFKNIHYSKNLIDLIAAASIDLEGEREHIDEYIKEHSLKEAYIIYLALGIDIPYNIKIESDMDVLIKQLVMDGEFHNAANLFSKVLSHSDHIFDALILKKIYTLFLSIHPEAKSIQEYNDLRVTAKKVTSVLNGIIMLLLTVTVCWIAIRYIDWSISNAKLHDEMQKLLLQIFSVILIVAIFLGLNIPDKVKILNTVRIKILTFIYFLLGLRYSDVEKILHLSLNENKEKRRKSSHHLN